MAIVVSVFPKTGTDEERYHVNQTFEVPQSDTRITRTGVKRQMGTMPVESKRKTS